MDLFLLVIEVLLIGVTLFSLFLSSRLHTRVYRTIKAGEPVNTKQNGSKLFFYNGVSLISWCLVSLMDISHATVSAVLLSCLKSLVEMLIFFISSGVCVWHMTQYNKNRQK